MDNQEKPNNPPQRPSRLQDALVYSGLLVFAIVAAIAAAIVAPLFLPKLSSLVGIEVVRGLAASVAFIVLHLLLELLLQSKESMKDLWPFRQVSRFKNWLWSFVSLTFAAGIATNLISNGIQQRLDAQHSKPAAPLVRGAQADALALAQPEQGQHAPRSPDNHAGQDTPPRSSSGFSDSLKPPSPSIEDSAPAYHVVFNIPTRFRDLEVLVDGTPARITDRQLSRITLLVPRKSSPIRFTLQSSLLSKPREFSLPISHDNFEYSPFQ